MTYCARCGELDRHVVHSHRHGPPDCTFDPAIPASRVRALPRFARDMYLHPEGMLVLWVDIEALLREAGVKP